MLLVQLKSADVSCGKATLRTSPSSGQAAMNSLLRLLRLPACHSGTALAKGNSWHLYVANLFIFVFRSSHSAKKFSKYMDLEVFEGSR